MRFGSDVVIEFLHAAGIEFASLNPGASFRGMQDSLVHAGDRGPEPIVVLHEEIAVGIAHGYAKAAGYPMAVFVHDLVGLQHASMAIFNAFVDNVPMLIIGGSGPRDAAKRRPWIDWVHAGHPQGSLVRDFVKWDDEPASVEAIPDSLARALRIACTAPMGPVYVSIDAELQEEAIGDRAITVRTMSPPVPVVAPTSVVERVARTLAGAKRPAILIDRPGPGAFDALVKVAEALPAAVVDLGGRGNFPTAHWANQSGDQRQILGSADFILALEVRDLAWPLTDLDLATRKTTWIPPADTPIVSVGLTETQHNGFLHRESLVTSVDYATSDVTGFLVALADHLPERKGTAPWEDERARLQADHERARAAARDTASSKTSGDLVDPAYLTWCLGEVIADRPWQLANGLIGGWPRKLWDFTHERQHIGRSGGEGLGYALPATIGAALAASTLPEAPLVIDIQPDGDMLYTAQALWTAAHHHLPMLIVMHNNRTYGKDELHQTEMAHARERGSLHRVGVGIHIDQPAVDFVGLARSYGVEAYGPISDPAELQPTLQEAADLVMTERRPVLVDVLCTRPSKSSY